MKGKDLLYQMSIRIVNEIGQISENADPEVTKWSLMREYWGFVKNVLSKDYTNKEYDVSTKNVQLYWEKGVCK